VKHPGSSFEVSGNSTRFKRLDATSVSVKLHINWLAQCTI